MVERYKQRIKLILHCLLINRNDTISIEPRTRKYVAGFGFLSFARKYKNQLSEIGLDSLKTASRKVIDKTAEGTSEFIGNKFADQIVKPKHLIDENSWNVEEIIIPTEKREEILNKLRQLL